MSSLEITELEREIALRKKQIGIEHVYLQAARYGFPTPQSIAVDPPPKLSKGISDVLVYEPSNFGQEIAGQ